MIRFICLFAAVGILSGCVSAYEPVNAKIKLYPVTYVLTLKADNRRVFSASVERFISRYHALLLTRPVTLRYANVAGRKLARAVRKQLRRQGVEADHIFVVSDTSITGDFAIYVTYYRVHHQACPPLKLEQRQPEVEGCFISFNRWHAMVNPVRPHSVITHPVKTDPVILPGK
jgi:type IV pilus biogenesis protein CpaD/CtpE